MANVSDIETATYRDKILPNQKFFRYMYDGEAPFEDAMFQVLTRFSHKFQPSRFKIEHPNDVDFESMTSPPFYLAIVNALIKLSSAKTVLEIGTFVGHSSMQFVEMVGKGGHVTTIEAYNEFFEIAERNFIANNMQDQITLIEGNASDVLATLPRRHYDLIFIDGAKQNYLEYALEAIDMITETGLILVDDIFFHGDALNEKPATDKGQGCKKVLDHFVSDDKMEKFIIPIGNGMLILHNRR